MHEATGAAAKSRSGSAPVPSASPFTRTLSEWLNLLIDTGFVLERLGESRPSDEAVRERPRLQSAQVVDFFVHVRARKPA